MRRPGDPIALVEACYDLRASEEAWLLGIARGVNGLAQVEHPTIAYHVELTADELRMGAVVQSDGGADVAGRLAKMARLLERSRAGDAGPLESLQAKIYEMVVRGGLRAPADSMLLAEFDKVGPDWMYTLGVPGVRDHLGLINHHIDGHGATLVVTGLSKKGSLRRAERDRYQMIGAHIKAGWRLRRRLGVLAPDVDVSDGGAVIDAESRVVHAEGEARQRDARERLEQMARHIDRARTERARHDDTALEVWQGLVDGTWSLVEQFDADGRRFLLAHRNPEDVRDPRGLGAMECRVAGLAVRGYSNKLIAYHLGLPEGTVSAHLHRVLSKLKLSSRVELVRTLGRHFPQKTDPRFED